MSEGTPIGMAGGAIRRTSGAMVNSGAGVPESVATACSNCPRVLRKTSTCVSVLSSNACCCATSRPDAAPRSCRAVASSNARRCSAIDWASTSISVSISRKLK